MAPATVASSVESLVASATSSDSEASGGASSVAESANSNFAFIADSGDIFILPGEFVGVVRDVSSFL